MSTITQTIMNAVTSAVSSDVVNVENYKTVNLTVSGASSPTGTIKFFASDSETAPDAASAQSPSNPWDYIAVVDLQSGSVIAGDTGIAFAGSADTRRFVVNSDGMRWIGAIVTSYSAGNYTVLLRAHSAMAPAI